MRRLLTTIVCVLCVLTASAVSYGASYKGSRYSGRIYTTSSARSTSIGSGGVLASAPLATMGSVSFGSRASQMSPIQTSGAAMVGGVASPVLSITPLKGGGSEAEVDCFCYDNNGDGKCDACDLPFNEFDGCGCDPCRCPIGDGWQVWLFMAVMAFAYAVFKKRKASL